MNFNEHFKNGHEAIFNYVNNRILTFFHEQVMLNVVYMSKTYMRDKWTSNFSVVFLEAVKIHVPYYEYIANGTRDAALRNMSNMLMIGGMSYIESRQNDQRWYPETQLHPLDFMRTLIRNIMSDNNDIIYDMFAQPWDAALVIQEQFRLCFCNSKYKICRKRLMREWEELKNSL